MKFHTAKYKNQWHDMRHRCVCERTISPRRKRVELRDLTAQHEAERRRGVPGVERD